jgi:hypothetical protein
VIEICTTKIFTLAEANALIPLLSRITSKHENAAEHFMSKQRYYLLSGASEDRVKETDTAVGKELVVWGTKIKKLGCKPLPYCFVGIPAGCFFWSWRPFESSIEHYHDYNESPERRRKLSIITGPVLG